MKRLFFSFTVFFITVSVFPQSGEPYTSHRNIIALGYFNAFELSRSPNLGIGYKRMVNHGAWRFGTGLIFDSSTEDNNNQRTTSNSFQISPRAGYEFHQYFNRIQLQYGPEVAFDYGRFPSKSYSDDELITDEITQLYDLQLRPFLGITVFLTKSVSIATETSLVFSYSIRNTDITTNGNTYSRSVKGGSIALSSLGVFSINIYF